MNIFIKLSFKKSKTLHSFSYFSFTQNLTGRDKMKLIIERQKQSNQKYSEENKLFEKKISPIFKYMYYIRSPIYITTIGVISLIDELKEITPRNKNPIKIRNFFITDYSISRVKVAVWGKQAEEFCYKLGDLLIFYNVKITYMFSEIALSVQRATNIEIC